MGANNHTTVRPTNGKLTTKMVAETVGKWYQTATPIPTDEIQEVADTVAEVNCHLYELIWLNGVEIEFTRSDPYPDFEAMVEDISENGNMRIFSGGSTPSYFTRHQNEIARAVHDYWGHYKHGVDFSFWGEFKKFHHMKKYYPEHTHSLLFAEVVGQTGFCHLLGGFDHPDFEQRDLMAPDYLIRFCYKNAPGGTFREH